MRIAHQGLFKAKRSNTDMVASSEQWMKAYLKPHDYNDMLKIEEEMG